MTSPPSLKDAIAKADLEHEFWLAHGRELLDRYPEQFVAVKDGEVVAHDPDLWMLVDSLSDFNLEPRDVLLEFLTNQQRKWIL